MSSNNWSFSSSEFLQGEDTNIKLKKLCHKHKSETRIYKYCVNGLSDTVYGTYSKCFRYECGQMQKLEKLMAETGHPDDYQRFFPKYYEYGLSPSGKPYIVMEYIEGQSLENKLMQHSHVSPPRSLLTSCQIRHLFDQLNTAQEWLHRAGMLQMDLSPQNIIVLNDKYDIKLVDFTDVYYLSEDIRKDRRREHKLVDFRISRNLSAERQLQVAGAALFTRLFYSGEKAYLQAFCPETRHHTFERYGTLLDCLSQRELVLETAPAENELHYWTLWYNELCRFF